VGHSALAAAAEVDSAWKELEDMSMCSLRQKETVSKSNLAAMAVSGDGMIFDGSQSNSTTLFMQRRHHAQDLKVQVGQGST